ncbi:MAG: Crp/Fnr family transcriptional regulator [Cytophagales bacterium]|nr:Crp/Fnr family transcriptional regulator [Armatimonadota bacterium]
MQRVLFLKNLSKETLLEIACAGTERRFTAGETLFCETDPCLGLLVVLEGAVKVCRIDRRGREFILGIERPGASIGDLALFDGGNYPASAFATQEKTRLLTVTPPVFASLMRRHPEIATGAVRALAIQQRRLVEMLKANTLQTVRARIAAYLLRAGEGQTIFTLMETNAQIGSHTGTVREVVSRTLHLLEDEGMLQLKGRTVLMLDHTALRRIADG